MSNHLQSSLTPVAAPIRWCFLLFIFSLFFENVQFAELMGFFTFSKFFGILLVGMALLQPKECFARPPKAFWFFLAFLGVYTLRGMAQVDIGDYTLAEITTVAQCLLLFWISSNILSHSGMWEFAFSTFVLANVLVAMMTFLGLAQIEAGRETVFGLDENDLAFNYAVGLLSAIALATDKKVAFFWRLAMIPMLLLLAAKCVTTGSRGAMLCVATGLLAYGIGAKGLTGKIKGLIVVGSLAVILGNIVLSTDIAQQRWQLTLEKGSVAGRDVIFWNSLDMFMEKPLIGWGPTTHLQEIAIRENSRSEIRGPHNDIMYVLTATGLAGGVFFVWGMWLCLWESWKGRLGPAGPFPFALIVAVFIMGMGMEIHRRKPYWVVAAMAVASGAVAADSRKNRSIQRSGQIPLRSGRQRNGETFSR